MTKKNIVLILGAGASHPFNFPLGPDLKLRICEMLSGITSGSARMRGLGVAANRMLQSGFGREHLVNFRDELRLSPRDSIDAFLLNKPQYVDVGRAAIIAALAPYESNTRLFATNTEGNWYRFLYQRMGSSLAEFHDNPLVVLTYNYDRSFETFMSTMLRREYELHDRQVAEAMQRLPVIHLHGTLGDHAYGADLEGLDLRLCAASIRIISEVRAETDENYKQAQRYLWDAEVVCFLGCAYHPENVNNLTISNSWPPNSSGARSGHPGPPRKRVLGTTFRLTVAEVNRARSRFTVEKRLSVEDSSLDVLQFLRHYDIFETDSGPVPRVSHV